MYRWSNFDASKDVTVFEAGTVTDPDYDNIHYTVSLKSYDGAAPKVAIEKSIERRGNTERANLGRIPVRCAAEIAALVIECVEHANAATEEAAEEQEATPPKSAKSRLAARAHEASLKKHGKRSK